MFNKKLIIDSLKNLSKPSRMTNKNTFDLKESGSKKEDFISAQEGVETPIYKAVKTGASPIEGKGLFAEQSIRKGDIIGVSHIRKKFMKNGEEYEAPFPSTVLGYYNHSEEPNVYEVDKGGYILMVAGRDIQRGHEITSDYNKHNIGDLEVPDDFKKGGSIKRPSLPNRKSPRSYSRSFEATNKLFAKNPLFAKSKSRKNKIFDPRAQYYDNGGINKLEGDLISKVIMNRNRGVDFVDRAYALGDNPGTPMFNLPDDEQFGQNMSHKMAWGDDDNGQAWMYPTIMNPNNEAIPVPNQYADYISSEGYKNATGMNQYAEGGLHKFVGGGNPTCEKPYVWNPETNRCEKKSGCPDDFHIDLKSGRCISNYQKETVKVMSAAYKYDKDGNKLSFPTDYDDSEFSPVSDDQLVYDKSSWPKDYSIKGIVNPIYFEDHGSILVSMPDYIPKYDGDSQGYIKTYPDLNYKVVVDSKKTEGYNKDESIYYVKSENTHQFKKYKEWEKLKKLEKDNIDNAKKLGLVMTEDESPTSVKIQKYPQAHYKTLKQLYDDEGNDVSSYWDNESYDFKPGMKDVYENDLKTLQELYNDPEYLGHEAYNKSFDETFKDRGTKNIERYKEMCPHCRYYHGQRMTIDPDYIYDVSNPYQNPVDEGRFTKPFYELEYEYADPTIESMYPKLEFEEGVDRPDYYPSYYDMEIPTISIGPGEQKSRKRTKRLFNGKGQKYTWTDYRQTKDVDFGEKKVTRLIPKMVQKLTGYDRNFMEGYEDKEGNYFPGEIEKAEEEGRQINFKGASSLRDRKQQKIYNEKWTNSEKQNKLIRQQNEDLLKEYGLNREEYVRLYGDFKNGGISLQLTKDEIQKYVDGGYVVEDLPKANKGKISKTGKRFFRSNYNPLSIPIKKIGERIARQSSTPSRSRNDIINALFKPKEYKPVYFGQLGSKDDYGIGKRDLVANYFRGNETGFKSTEYDMASDPGLHAAIEEYGPLKVFLMNSKIQHEQPIDFYTKLANQYYRPNMIMRKEGDGYMGGSGYYGNRMDYPFTKDMHIQSKILGIDSHIKDLNMSQIKDLLEHDRDALAELSHHSKQSLNQLFEQYGKDSIPFEIDPHYSGQQVPFEFIDSPVDPIDNVGGHMAFLKRLPNKEFELTSRDLWGFTPSYNEKWVMDTSFQKAQRKAMDMFGKPFVLTQTNPIKFKQGGESNYELGEEIEDGGDPDPLDPHQLFLKNWYENRVFPKEMQKAKPILLNQLEQLFPPYVPTDALPTNVAAAYNYDDNIVELNKNYPVELQEGSKTHENNHYLTQDANEYLDKPHTNLIEQNIINPKDINTGNKEWDKAYKENFDEIVSPEEMHSRIMTLRELAGFKPDQVITEKDVEDYFESVGDKLDPDVQDIKQVTKGNKAIVELLNYMASNNSNEDLNVAKYGGTTDYELGEEIDEATMKKLKKLGYTFEII